MTDRDDIPTVAKAPGATVAICPTCGASVRVHRRAEIVACSGCVTANRLGGTFRVVIVEVAA